MLRAASIVAAEAREAGRIVAHLGRSLAPLPRLIARDACAVLAAAFFAGGFGLGLDTLITLVAP